MYFISFIYLFLLLSFLTYTTAVIPVDNGLEKEPDVECGPNSITVNFNTRNKFEGHVYVKGLYDQSACRNDEGGRQVAGIEILFDTCNLIKTRSLNPRGVFISTTVVISFHPQFLTKVDKAYRVQCFYMEADKSVNADLEVNDLTTIVQQHDLAMPVCKYQILENNSSGHQVSLTTIGSTVYHKWHCNTETINTFCMIVHSCTVDDGNNENIQILDENGCALDKVLLPNLDYQSDLSAGQETHVYKYADRTQMFYQCQISITIKDTGKQCPRPKCVEPNGFGATKTSNDPIMSDASNSSIFDEIQPELKAVKKRNTEMNNTLDVRTEITAFENIEDVCFLDIILLHSLFICYLGSKGNKLLTSQEKSSYATISFCQVRQQERVLDSS
uniref:ZP domain-containing protein n=1 Tax=Rhabditophanes sp. KR3021 TaxID=114890 RepID=A0AC35U442_9BILA